MNRTLSTFLLLATLVGVNAQQEADLEIGVIEKLDQFIPMDAMLIDEHGDTVIIGDLIDKPTILNFVYFRCPGICSPLMDGLADAMDARVRRAGRRKRTGAQSGRREHPASHSHRAGWNDHGH